MFDYTRTALKKILNDFNNIIFGINIFSQLFMIGYLTYAVCAQTGVFIANIILLVLAVAHFVFFLYFTHRTNTQKKKEHLLTKKERKLIKKENKKVKKNIDNVYAWCKRSVKLFSIIVTAYGLFITNQNIQLIPLLLLIFTMIGWVLEFLIYIIKMFIESEINLAIEAWQLDLDPIKKSATNVKNFIGRVVGKEPAPETEKAPSKNQEMLDRLIVEEKVEKELKNKEKRKADLSKADTILQRISATIIRKKVLHIEEPIKPDRIPAPVEEELAIEVTPPWESENE